MICQVTCSNDSLRKLIHPQEAKWGMLYRTVSTDHPSDNGSIMTRTFQDNDNAIRLVCLARSNDTHPMMSTYTIALNLEKPFDHGFMLEALPLECVVTLQNE